MIGLPYAEAVVENGVLFSRCPECGVLCPEGHDDTGEQTTNRYAEHYQSEHAPHAAPLADIVAVGAVWADSDGQFATGYDDEQMDTVWESVPCACGQSAVVLDSTGVYWCRPAVDAAVATIPTT